MDEDAARLQQAALLSRDLTPHPIGVCGPMPVAEFGRPEESAVLDGIERGGRQGVEGTGGPEIKGVVLEGLTVEVTEIDPNRLGAELEQQPAHPGLELGGPPAGPG